jgi:hypothetical protein
MFKDGRSNIHDEERSGHPSIVTENLKQRVEQVDKINKFHVFCYVHEVGTDHLGYRKICARWVTKKLTHQHKENRMVAGRLFLDRYRREGDNFLNHIVTGDET